MDTTKNNTIDDPLEFEVARGIAHFQQMLNDRVRIVGTVLAAQWVRFEDGSTATAMAIDDGPDKSVVVWNLHHRAVTSRTAPYTQQGNFMIQPEAIVDCVVDFICSPDYGMLVLEAVMGVEY